MESEVKELRLRAEENKQINDAQFDKVSDEFDAVNKKLDDLLTLRSKGIGAFWLASVLFGTGLVGGLIAFFNWLIGK